VISPLQFRNVVEHIRNEFEADEKMCVDIVSVCSRAVPDAVCSAAVAALINCNFLRLTDELCLVKADVELMPPTRRTA
jgi:hypothetical protein